MAAENNEATNEEDFMIYSYITVNGVVSDAKM